jgi:mono/diheme cytochrome c family protein
MNRALTNFVLYAIVAAATFLVCFPAARAQDGPPPFPLYQLREEVAEGDRLDSQATGAELYSNRCGHCHLPNGMGTNMLTVQRMRLGESPEKGLLVNRDDLVAAYVKSVVRAGKGAMPRLTAVDVTDSELELIAAYLDGGTE